MPDFTKTEKKIMQVLDDGMRHTLREIKVCLDDELAENPAVYMHLQRIRDKIRPTGKDILCEYHHGTYYRRLVVLIGSSNKE